VDVTYLRYVVTYISQNTEYGNSFNDS